MLVVIAHGDPRSGLDPPFARAELAEERLEQTGLPRAVGPDDRHPLPGGHRKARDREAPARAFPRWPGVHELEAIALKDQLARAGGLQPDADLPVVGGRRQAFQPVELCLATARLARALTGFVAADELFGARDVILLRLVLLPPHGPPFAAQPKVLPVVAGIPLAGRCLQLEDVVGGVLEEAAVVRDDQHTRP